MVVSMTKDEALKLALEALKQIDEAMPFPVAKLAQKVIKEALAEPEQPPYHHFVSDRFNIDPQTGNLNIGAVKKQEPVAWAKFSAKGNIIDLLNEPDDDYTPLYTTPPQGIYYTPPQRTWVGLTDGEVDKMILLMGFPPDWITENAIVKNIVRNLEAKLRSKNSG
jgi:hypothetical protein